MAEEFSKAIIETGALVLGGIAGGGLSWVLIGDQWLLNGVFAVAGAWLVHRLAVPANGRPE